MKCHLTVPSDAFGEMIVLTADAPNDLLLSEVISGASGSGRLPQASPTEPE